MIEMNENVKIAKELVKIAAEVIHSPELDKIDGMNIGQLIDFIYRNKSNYTSMGNSKKVNKFKDRIDTTKPARNMTVRQMLQNVAKMGVEIKEKENKG